DYALVALAGNRKPALDPVEWTVLLDAFQRACVELVRRVGEVACGPVRHQGVVFLSSSTGSAQRKRQRIVDLSDKVLRLGQRHFGLSLHFGASGTPGSAPLSRSYRAALGAAQSAQVRDQRLLFAAPGSEETPRTLKELRAELARDSAERPGFLQDRFERYMESSARASGYRVESTRTHLEVG